MWQILSQGQSLTDYYRALDSSVAMRGQTRRTFSALLEAESSQRGFLLPGHQAFLGSYEAAERDLSTSLQAMLSGISIEPAARRLSELIPTRIAEFERAITAYREGGLTAATQVVAGGQASFSESWRSRLRMTALLDRGQDHLPQRFSAQLLVSAV